MDDKARKIRRLQIFVFIAFTIAFSVPNYSQYQLSPLATRLMGELSLSQAQFVSCFSAPMIPAIFLSIICGILVDKFGAKYVIWISILLSAVGIIGRIFAPNYALLRVFMILLGVSSGCVNCTGSKIIGSAYPTERVGVIVGYAVTIGTATMILAMSTTAYLQTKTAFIIAAVLIIIDVIAWIICCPSKKQLADIAVVSDALAAPEESVSVVECIKVVLKNKYVWFVGAGLFCVNAAMAGMNGLISDALVSRGMTETAAGTVSSFTLVGNLLGSLFSPTIAAKTGKTRLILIVCSLIAAAGTAFSWLAPAGIMLYIALLLTGLGVGSVLPQLIGINIRLPGVGPKYSGTAGGVIATLQLLGGVLLPSYVAAPIANGNYHVYFPIIGGAMIICAIAMYLLPKSLDVKVG
ncbi:MAG: MFS transporter [Oscillospiraceae bacterium]|nr:MFS transporter [Oscillospiraceae bacterium]